MHLVPSHNSMVAEIVELGFARALWHGSALLPALERNLDAAMSQHIITPLAIKREEALRSLDLTKMRAVMLDIGMPPEANDHTVMIFMHKTRLAMREFSRAEKLYSYQWLVKRGYDPQVRGAKAKRQKLIQ